MYRYVSPLKGLVKEFHTYHHLYKSAEYLQFREELPSSYLLHKKCRRNLHFDSGLEVHRAILAAAPG